MIENRNKIIYIHDKEVNNLSEYNLLHDIINPPIRAKNINSHYSPILHGVKFLMEHLAPVKQIQ